MTDVDDFYRSKYRLPNCSECEENSLEYNTYMVYKVELFCANDQCSAFVKTYWVDKKDLESRDGS